MAEEGMMKKTGINVYELGLLFSTKELKKMADAGPQIVIIKRWPDYPDYLFDVEIKPLEEEKEPTRLKKCFEY